MLALEKMLVASSSALIHPVCVCGCVRVVSCIQHWAFTNAMYLSYTHTHVTTSEFYFKDLKAVFFLFSEKQHLRLSIISVWKFHRMKE